MLQGITMDNVRREKGKIDKNIKAQWKFMFVYHFQVENK